MQSPEQKAVEVTWMPCTAADMKILLPMMEAFVTDEGRTFDRERCREDVCYLLGHREFGGIWLVRADGVSVGYLVVTLGYSFEFGGHDSFIDEVYVEPHWRHRGIGMQTVKFAELAARELGARWLHLEAARGKDGLDGFYKQAGFQDRGYCLLSKPLV